MKLKIILLLFFFGFFMQILAQDKFLDKDYYLVDSLVFDEISSTDWHAIDSSLKVFYDTYVDTTKAEIIASLTNQVMDDDIWPRYNLWVKRFAEDKLKTKIRKEEKKCFNILLAGCLNNIGYLYNSKGEVTKALPYFYDCIEIYKELGNLKGIATINNNLGYIYNNKGDVLNALERYHYSLKIEEQLGNKKGIALGLNNIGFIYYNQDDIDNALVFFEKSLSLREEIGDQSGIANSLNNLGYMYLKNGEEEKALSYYERGVQIRKDIGDEIGYAGMILNLGTIYEKMDSTIKAVAFYKEALSIQEKVGNKKGIASALVNLANVSMFEKNNNLAESRLLRAYSLAHEIGNPKLISETSKNLSRLSKNQNNYKRAYEMYQVYVNMRDSINNDRTKTKSIQQQAKYLYEKQKTIDDLEYDKLLEHQKIENEKKIAIEKEQQAKQQVIIYATAIGLLLVIVFFGFVYKRLQITKKQKLIIEHQKEKVEKARQDADRQKEIIENRQTEITASIEYAKRLQDALLPSKEDIDRSLAQNFVLFLPKDVVSGDFYWFDKKDKVRFIAAADCTGHGVPGALVSVVCSSALHRSVNEFGLVSPAGILDKTRELVIESFAKNSKDVKDGMDICLVSIHESKITYSGANNPLWIVRDKKLLSDAQLTAKSTCVLGEKALIEFKPNKQPIGLYENMSVFTEVSIETFEGDTLYLSTDGYADQFGGANGKKLKYKPFKRLLLEISKDELPQQRIALLSFFSKWRGQNEQLDDICIVGVRL